MTENNSMEIMQSAHRHTMGNRSEIERSERCGCACCEHIFPAAEVEDYIDNGSTAICPYCGCDAVIADASGFELTAGFLRQMNERYF